MNLFVLNAWGRTVRRLSLNRRTLSMVVLCCFLAHANGLFYANGLDSPNGMQQGIDSNGNVTEGSQRPLSSLMTQLSSFLPGFSMTLFSELGDKTFFIAAVFAMKYNALVVLWGSLTALLLMTVISVILGASLLQFLNPLYTDIIVFFLFLFFGASLLYEAVYTSRDDVDIESHIVRRDSEVRLSSSHPLYIFSKAKEYAKSLIPSSLRWPYAFHPFMLHYDTIFFKVLYLVFLAEWGDRSQIATIALAASRNASGVALGVFSAHCICTLLAVLGGQFMSQYVNERVMCFIGAATFFLFSALYAVRLLNLYLHT